jgi:hypothetical protein
MSQRAWARISSLFLVCVAAISTAQPVMACSVCYGDPNSPMTKGVEAGVLVLLGVVGTVLLLLASLLLFWMRRAARLDEAGKSVGQVSTAWASEPRVSS